MDYIFRPLGAWPRKTTPPTDRKERPFSSTLGKTYRQLDKELLHLQAQSPVVLQVALEEKHIRLDGKIRADAPTPSHPGVVVAFTGRVAGRPTPLMFMCDDCRAWQDNLRAIVLTLERLRLADLYGVTKSGEQYAGWRALPGGDAPATTAENMTVEHASRVVASAAGVSASDVLDATRWRSTYFAGAKHRHPDSGGQSHEAWSEFQTAANVVKEYLGIA